MIHAPTLLIIAVTVVAVAIGCDVLLAGRVRSGAIGYGRASAATLAALLIAPPVAAVLALTVIDAAVPASYGMGLYFYFGYAVGLACFIVLNRRFRKLGGG